MFNPLSLRLCCLATMAPALTSEAATRARDKLPGSPVSPSSQVSLISGRDCHLTSTSSTKGGGESHFSFKTVPQLATLSKELQRRLTERAQLANSKDCGYQNFKQKQVSLITLTSLASISELYHKQQHLLDKSTLLHHSPNQTDSSFVIETSSTMDKMSTSIDNNLQSNSTLLTVSSSRSADNGLLQPTTPVHSKLTTQYDSEPTHTRKSTNPHIDDDTTRSTSNPFNSLPVPSRQNQVVNSEKLKLSNGFCSRSKLSKEDGEKIPAMKPSSSHDVSGQRDDVPTEKIRSSSMSVHATNQLLDSVARRHKFLENKTIRLLKKLRRLQSRQAVSHTKKQLGNFMEQQKNASSAGKSRNNEVDLKTELLQSQNAKGMSTAALVSLIHKWQCAQTSSLRQQLLGPPCSQGSPERMDEDTCMDMDRVAGHLSSNLAHLHTGLDSDATESSSGGESGEEWDLDDDWDNTTSHPPIQCRAEWRWATERAAIAARWTWLQAQVSDLEYRIRQQYDIYKQIRANKGAVTLGDATPSPQFVAKPDDLRQSLEEKVHVPSKIDASPSSVSTLLSNVDKQAKLLRTQQLGPLYTPQQSPSSTSSGSNVLTPKTPNGFVDKYDDSRITVTSSGGAISIVNSQSIQGARCRPVESYRKRKLLRTAGLYHVNRKAARLSTVQCHCFPPISSCAMCGGRYNNTVSMQPETMPCCEKIALVDVSFHPVLSFTQDVPLSTHFESMLKTGEWQQKPPPRTLKVFPNDHRRSTLSERVRKYSRKLKNKNTSATILSSKIRNKYDLKQLNRTQSSLMNSSINGNMDRSKLRKIGRTDIQVRKRKASLQNIGTDHQDQKSLLDNFASVKDELGLGGQGLTPRESWLRKKRERGESAYDINNIVIPYSIASSTRVEKLQYKEILTPKWREVVEISLEQKDVVEEPSDKNGDEQNVCSDATCASVDKTSPSDIIEMEDLCDEAYRLRHIKCEVSEKKRFSTVLPLSAGLSQRRSRGAQRSDSLTSVPTMDTPVSSTLENTTVEEGSLVYRTSTPPPAVTGTNIDEPIESLPTDPSSECTRTRSSSMSSSKSVQSRSASHSEERMSVPSTTPWPKRTFPLTEQDFGALMDHNTSNRVDINHSRATVIENASLPKYNCSVEENIVTDDNNSDVLEEDPDDPEWTVVSEKAIVTKQPNNIVLKLAKR